jgi:hypothetical protein
LLNDCFHDFQTRQAVQQKLFDKGIINMETLKQSLDTLSDIIGLENTNAIAFQIIQYTFLFFTFKLVFLHSSQFLNELDCHLLNTKQVGNDTVHIKKFS